MTCFYLDTIYAAAKSLAFPTSFLGRYVKFMGCWTHTDLGLNPGPIT